MKLCPVPGCPTPTTGGRCAQHRTQRQQQADAERGTAQQRGYTYHWAQFSKRWLSTHGVCGMRADMRVHLDHSLCAQQGRYTTVDLVTDHILPMAQGGAQYDEANLQTLCRACNSRKDTGFGGRAGHTGNAAGTACTQKAEGVVP